MYKRKLKVKRIFISLSLLLIVVLIGIILYLYFNVEKTSAYNMNIKKIIDSTKDEVVSLNKVRIYGTHLNINGTLENKKVFLDNIDDAKLIFKNINSNKDIEIDIEYDVNNKGNLTFYTSDKINTGINLDSLNTGNYIILLKLLEKNYNENKDDTNYYKIINEDNQKEFTYYTMTKNNKNNKIVINNYKNEIEKKSYKYMKIDIESTKLPDDVYDIVIDPGHGGNDNGTSYLDVFEDELNLKLSTILYEMILDDGGICYLSRVSDYDLSSMYAKNHKIEDLKKRVQYIDSLNTTLFISLHLNYYSSSKVNGIQVFYQKQNQESKELATFLQDILNVENQRKKQCKVGDYFILNNTTSLGVLIEYGFLSSEYDRQRLLDDNYLNHLAKLIKSSISEYLKNKLKY